MAIKITLKPAKVTPLSSGSGLQNKTSRRIAAFLFYYLSEQGTCWFNVNFQKLTIQVTITVSFQ